MSLPWEALGLWPVRVIAVGAAILLLGRLLMAMTHQPARRRWVGTAAVVAALLAIPLTLVPGWWRISLPTTSTATPMPGPRQAEVATTVPPQPAASSSPGDFAAARASGVASAARALAPRASADVPVEAGTRGAEATPLAGVKPPMVEPAPTELDWLRFGGWAYGFVVLALFVRLVVGHLALARLWRRAHLAPAWAESVFRRLAQPVCPRANLRVCSGGSGPVCFGVVRPRVLVPASLLASGDGPGLRAVFAHELAHLGRRDPLAGWLLGLARAAYFICPWQAGLRREVRLAQECLADAAAVSHAAGPAEYAELLIRLARSRPAPLGAAGVRGPHSDLYRRVTMLLQTKGGVESRCPRRWALAVGGGLTALAVLVAGLSVQPRAATAAEPQPKDPVKKEAGKKEPARTASDKKDAPKVDPFKDLMDKLRKDLKDDPEALKNLDELINEAKKRQVPDEDGRVAPRGQNPALPLPLPPFLPPGGLGRLDPDKELEMAQEMLRQQLEMLEKQLRAGGLRGGGLLLGPDAVRPFPIAVGGGGGVRLGVRVERPSDVLASQLDLPAGQGLVCVDVPADSVAGKAGIKPNDIMLEIGGKAVSSNFPEFQKLLSDVKPDAAVDFVVLRKGKKETIKGVKLPEAKPFADFPALALPGLEVAPVDPLPGPVARPNVVVGPGETVRVEQVNDAFTVFYAKNGVKVTVAGSKEGGTPKAESIEVDDNGKTSRAESIEKLPKEYQDLAKAAMKAIK